MLLKTSGMKQRVFLKKKTVGGGGKERNSDDNGGHWGFIVVSYRVD